MILFKKWFLLSLFAGFLSLQVGGLASANAASCEVCRAETSKTCSGCGSVSYCGKSHQLAARKMHRPLCELLAPYKTRLQNKLEIKPSPLNEKAGRGLFATQSFKKDEPVAIYFGKIVDLKKAQNLIELSQYGNPYLMSGNKTNHHSLIFSPNESPLPYLSAAMANDPSMDAASYQQLVNFDFNRLDEELPKLKSWIRQYALKLVQPDQGNIKFNGILIGGEYPLFVASRDIEAGEEILYNYGLEYWVEIPMAIARKKSLLKEVYFIKQAVSEAAEEFIADMKDQLKGKQSPETIDALNPANLLISLYAPRERFEADMKTITAHRRTELGLRFASMFGPLTSIQCFFVGSNNAGQDAHLDNLERYLVSVASAPNTQFYDAVRGPLVDRDAVALLKTLSDKNLVQIINTRTGKILPVDQFLSEETK